MNRVRWLLQALGVVFLVLLVLGAGYMLGGSRFQARAPEATARLR